MNVHYHPYKQNHYKLGEKIFLVLIQLCYMIAIFNNIVELFLIKSSGFFFSRWYLSILTHLSQRSILTGEAKSKFISIIFYFTHHQGRKRTLVFQDPYVIKCLKKNNSELTKTHRLRLHLYLGQWYHYSPKSQYFPQTYSFLEEFCSVHEPEHFPNQTPGGSNSEPQSKNIYTYIYTHIIIRSCYLTRHFSLHLI